MALIINKKTGRKMYPVCSWEENQHKLYNAHDRLMCALYDGEDVDEEIEKLERALDIFNSNVYHGIVYAEWSDAQIIKDYIWAYNARH